MDPTGTQTEQATRGTGMPSSMGGILDRVESAAAAPEIRVGDVIASLGSASFAAVLMLPAMAVVTPLSGIPLFSSFCGMMIALVSVQMLWGRTHLWLPRFITGRRLSSARVTAAVHWLRGPVSWLDRMTAPRLNVLLHPPLVIVPQFLCLLCGLAMPFLEFLPFTSTILGAAVVLMAMSMVVRDGVFALAGIATISAAVGTIMGLTALVT